MITACLNSEKHIERAINSLLSQTYDNIEHIVIDGGSKDATLKILDKYKNNIAYLLSEPDKGIYDAMNKGIRLATGDIVGILNSDDFYAGPRVLEKVADLFLKTGAEALFGGAGGGGNASFQADGFTEELGQGCVGGALAQRPLDIQLRRGKETRPQPTGRGEAQAVAGGTVVIADGTDEA